MYMGLKKIYDKLVLRWGRELANEIIAKRQAKSSQRQAKGGSKKLDMLDSRARVPGSFESGKKR